MTTENPQDESPVEENVIEQIDVTSAPEPVETASPQAETAPAVPQLTLGQTGAAADVEPVETEEPAFQPVIRGRVDKAGTAIGTGRRKTAVARVRLKPGSGNFSVNGREFAEFFNIERDRAMVEAPLKAVGEFGKVDVWVRVNGGASRARPVRLSWVLPVPCSGNPNSTPYSPRGYLTRDGRMVERKKYGKRRLVAASSSPSDNLLRTPRPPSTGMRQTDRK
ncbi:MAG: 30S ribosomal protein S9 [Planctomycetaceae bacterium]